MRAISKGKEDGESRETKQEREEEEAARRRRRSKPLSMNYILPLSLCNVLQLKGEGGRGGEEGGAAGGG